MVCASCVLVDNVSLHLEDMKSNDERHENDSGTICDGLFTPESAI